VPVLPHEELTNNSNPNENPSAAILLATHGPAEANLNVPRKFQPRNTTNHRFRTRKAPIGTNTCTKYNRGMFRGNKHPFTRSRVDNNLTGHDENGKLHMKSNSSLVRPNHAPSCHRRPSTAQINQRIPLRNAKQQTNIPTRNERTTRKKLASLASAKRSVVTSDAAGTHSPSPGIHSELRADELLSTKRTDRITQLQIPQTTRQILEIWSRFRYSVAKSVHS